MSDIENVFVLVDVKVIPLFPFAGKQNIPNAVHNGQIIGKIVQFLYKGKNQG
jgi:hypothetical protein